MKKTYLVLVVTFAAAALAAKPDQPDVTKLPPALIKAGVTYEKDIKPLFSENCFKCHGAEKHKGKLRLDSLDAAMKSGENAPNIIAGTSAKSPLVWAIARIGDEDDAMPPTPKTGKAKELTKEQVGLIRAWIDQGAK